MASPRKLGTKPLYHRRTEGDKQISEEGGRVAHEESRVGGLRGAPHLLALPRPYPQVSAPHHPGAPEVYGGRPL